MRFLRTFGLSVLMVAGATTIFADQPPLDCSKKSLANAVASAASGEAINFTGICKGPVVVATDGISLTGVGNAVIDGGGQDALKVAGADRVSLTGVEVRNGANGIVGVNGAHIALKSVSVHDNLESGISLQTSSSAILSAVTITHNGVHGLDLETGSAATISGTFTSSQNRVFGINVNGSSLTFSRATATVSGNALGIQVATGANAFINDSQTVLNVTNNLAVGLTVVSGAHMVSFGGTINASGNPVAGVSVNSKGGLDLDAGSQLNTFNNGDGVLMQESSVMTVFNNPQFSGVSGFSTVNSHNNLQSGLRVQTGSVLTLSNQAKVTGTQNATGLIADNGVGITLVNSTLTGNNVKDLQLTFGTRADLQTLTLGTYTCDATVLVRGMSLNCPH
jgi:hypothetical protein